MWKLYRNRHLWLLQVYRLFSSFYGNLQGDVSDLVKQEPSSYGRRILSIDNSTSSLDEDVEVPRGCIPPSLEEFPEDFFTQEQREHGGVIVHILIVVYICSMLAIVCDKYFVPCLKVMSSYFKVPEDIAGATFMAVGTSSPELFSSLIGAFVTEGDIGVGTVVGSAVFNLLLVTGAAGFAVGSSVIQLDWFPISRDCTMYIITISTLVFVIHDNLVTWIEALVLIFMFIGYLALLYFNCHVQSITTKTAKNVQKWWWTKKGVGLEGLPVTIYDETSALLVASRLNHHYHSHDDSACPSSGSNSLEASSELTSSGESDTLAKESGHFNPPILVPQLLSGKYIVVKDVEDLTASMEKVSNSLEESLEVNLWQFPEGILKKLLYIIMWPSNLLFAITIPRCNLPGRTKMFPITFVTSIMWLGTLSYLCFWMVAIIGYTFGIPDTVSGITILAAGTSVPELVSSVIVVRNGLGNMAFSNLLGSNIFDILFCLGVPWLVKTLLNHETHSLVINSSALTYTTIILLSIIFLFYITLLCCRWELNWKYGIVAFVLYAGFLAIGSLYESNVFGDFNPPTCVS